MRKWNGSRTRSMHGVEYVSHFQEEPNIELPGSIRLLHLTLVTEIVAYQYYGVIRGTK